VGDDFSITFIPFVPQILRLSCLFAVQLLYSGNSEYGPYAKTPFFCIICNPTMTGHSSLSLTRLHRRCHHVQTESDSHKSPSGPSRPCYTRSLLLLWFIICHSQVASCCPVPISCSIHIVSMQNLMLSLCLTLLPFLLFLLLLCVILPKCMHQEKCLYFFHVFLVF
jgi:hypothetical protein